MDIWKNQLDGRYDCCVVRIGEYQGRLTVTDTVEGTELLNEEVGLMYDAQFGPDISDVYSWEGKCVAAVDGPES